MLLWLIVPAMIALLVGLGALAVSRHYRTPRVAHRRTPVDLGIAFEELRFPTANGKRLYGWWIPTERPVSSAAPTIILVHGWARNVERTLSLITLLHPCGLNILAFDARSHGSSDDDGIANILKFSADIRAAVDEALRRPGIDPERLGVVGLSIGGAASIHAGSLDPRLRAVATNGAFAHPGDLMRYELGRKGVPRLAISLILRYVEHRIGARLDDIAPEKRLAYVKAPTLLIHGEDDAIVPVEHASRLHLAGTDTVELLLLPSCGHSDCDRHPDFSPRLLGFLGSALSADLSSCLETT
jgi:dipeptidyl aminopeptidase/acylaminoacyl peptidase